jgi:eukaryotic-like serine/threonine-protein kinase
MPEKTGSISPRTQLGRYEVRHFIGSGGMGEVYLAWDTQLDRNVALKILPANLASNHHRMQRFIREAKAASALSHPNIAHVYEIGKSDDISFIAFEYVEGENLEARIRRGPLDFYEIISVGIQIADALDEAHAKGITHRDIKPSNIVISTRGQAKILDFGLAKMTAYSEDVDHVVTELQTNPGAVIGTTQYMSPEQALGRDLDQRTDIFSIGVVFYEMATGQLPFVGANNNEIVDRILHSEPERITDSNRHIPPELERVITKCLEKDPDRRYQRARDLELELKNVRDAATKSSFKPAHS